MSKPTVVLTTLNARYSHTSFGLRYLLANLGEWQAQAVIREFTIHHSPLEIAESLLLEEPVLIGFGIYIWNVEQTVEVMELLRRLRPELILVIGGPEVSYEFEGTRAFELCDHLIVGEADEAFRTLVTARLAGELPPKLIQPPLPDLEKLVLPYDCYSNEDLRQRLIYVEASRGCPFQCEFCLSSLEIPVRAFSLEKFLASLKSLLDRGARSFKFVDRTFNLNLNLSTAILRFCLEHCPPEFELHFEMIPDRLPEALRSLVSQFRPGQVQFEIGIQTFTPQVSKNISRPLKVDKIEDNFAFLRAHTGVHLHADLIFGLPGETLETFAQSFDKLLHLDPDEIQLGILKRLKGTPLVKRVEPFALVFAPRPPYEILQTSTVDFWTMQRMKRFARYLDLFHNSGNFRASLPRVYALGDSPFDGFLRFSDWLYETTRQTHQFGLSRLYQLLFQYLVEIHGLEAGAVAESLLLDYDRQQIRRERLEFLRPYVPTVAAPLTHLANPTGPLAGGEAAGAKRGSSLSASHGERRKGKGPQAGQVEAPTA